jgi:dienelactone hydrolase
LPTEKPLEYHGADGRRYVGFLALPDTASGAGVLIAHGAPGLEEHERDVACRMAALGYVALAIDYHGDGATFSTAPHLVDGIMAVLDDPAVLRDPMIAGLNALRVRSDVDPSRIAVVGYCLGGAAALELAYSGAEVTAFVGLHSTLAERPAESYRRIKGKVLILHGSRDPLISAAQRATFEKNMDEARVDWRFFIYGGAPHAFSMKTVNAHNMPGVEYEERTDKRSWRAMLDFLSETIGRP